MAEHEQAYWWHLGRLRIIETYLRVARLPSQKAKLLNVGCGTGGTVPTLEKFGAVDNVDTSDQAIAFMKQRGYSRVTKVHGTALPFTGGSYDLVVAFDVLEHIEDHLGALREWSRVLKDDGAIVLTVPAYQWLWSGHDVALGHHRRYTAQRLKAAAALTGLRPQKMSYAIIFSLPLVIGFRLLGRLRGESADAEASYVSLPGWLNRLFTALLYGEAKLHGHMGFPAGTSVVAIFRKAL